MATPFQIAFNGDGSATVSALTQRGTMVALLLAAVLAAAAFGDDRAPSGPMLLIVAPTAIAPVADEWAVRRRDRGWHVETLILEPDAVESSDPEALRLRVRAFVAEHDHADGIAPAILLLGDVPSGGIPGLPTFRFDQTDPRLVDRADPRRSAQFASDRPFAVDDDPQRPFASIGRVPVRSVDEARAMLAKVVRHEDEATHGSWRSHLTFVAGEGRFGAGDIVLESLVRGLVTMTIDPAMTMSMTYASASSVYCPPPSSLEAIVRDRFAEPALLVTYLGHGNVFSLDRMRWGARRVPMLGAASISSLVEPASDIPIAFLGCCDSGWFDLEDGRRSLAEEMLLTPGGPVATIAGSRMTHPYGTAVLTRTLLRTLVEERAPTLGELDRRAVTSLFRPDDALRTLDLLTLPIAQAMRWEVSLPELRLMHTRLYNLLGDPSMLLALPPPSAALRLDGNRVVGTVDGLVAGVAVIEIETSRARTVHHAAGTPLLPPSATELGDLEAIAGRNYPRANERVLGRLETPLGGSTVIIELPSPMPVGAAVIRVRIEGRDADGQPVRALGAVVLPEWPPAAARR